MWWYNWRQVAARGDRRNQTHAMASARRLDDGRVAFRPPSPPRVMIGADVHFRWQKNFHRRFSRWAEKGVWENLFKALADVARKTPLASLQELLRPSVIQALGDAFTPARPAKSDDALTH